MSRDESTRPAAEGRFADLGRVHLLGIGGVGVSGVARILQEQGVAVSGSDAKALPVMRELAAGGARITVGYDAAHLGRDVTTVIASSIAGPGTCRCRVRSGPSAIRNVARWPTPVSPGSTVRPVTNRSGATPSRVAVP